MQLLNLLRPRRRWIQFSLRTLFVLTTLICIRLSYHAWRFQTEREIVSLNVHQARYRCGLFLRHISL
jgi:hypothetical protein